MERASKTTTLIIIIWWAMMNTSINWGIRRRTLMRIKLLRKLIFITICLRKRENKSKRVWRNYCRGRELPKLPWKIVKRNTTSRCLSCWPNLIFWRTRMLTSLRKSKRRSSSWPVCRPSSARGRPRTEMQIGILSFIFIPDMIYITFQLLHIISR